MAAIRLRPVVGHRARRLLSRRQRLGLFEYDKATAVAGALAEKGYGRVYEDWTVCVVDETGEEVARVAIQPMTRH